MPHNYNLHNKELFDNIIEEKSIIFNINPVDFGQQITINFHKYNLHDKYIKSLKINGVDNCTRYSINIVGTVIYNGVFENNKELIPDNVILLIKLLKHHDIRLILYVDEPNLSYIQIKVEYVLFNKEYNNNLSLRFINQLICNDGKYNILMYVAGMGGTTFYQYRKYNQVIAYIDEHKHLPDYIYKESEHIAEVHREYDDYKLRTREEFKEDIKNNNAEYIKIGRFDGVVNEDIKPLMYSYDFVLNSYLINGSSYFMIKNNNYIHYYMITCRSHTDTICNITFTFDDNPIFLKSYLCYDDKKLKLSLIKNQNKFTIREINNTNQLNLLYCNHQLLIKYVSKTSNNPFSDVTMTGVYWNEEIRKKFGKSTFININHIP